jgi:hypothetical protein
MKHREMIPGKCRPNTGSTLRPTQLQPAWRRWLLAATLAALALVARPTAAEVVTWNVDQIQSYLRLTIPDQTVAVTNLGNVTVRIRDANSTTQWTDAGGRRAALDGLLATDFVDGTSITFLGGTHNLFAIEGTSLRPNPTDWSAATTNYVGTTTAPAALGGRVRGTYILTFDAAFLAFRDLKLDITNLTAGPLLLTNGAFASGATRCGIASAVADVDGLELPLGLGQPIPDLLDAALSPVVQTNAAGGSITNLGGLNRQLTYNISLPTLTFDLGGTLVSGSAAGLIVATATLPAPPPPPILTVRRQPAEVVLTWPTNAIGFSLQYATNFPATAWLPALPPPVVATGQFVVTNRTTLGAAYYRLRKP